MYDDDRPRRSYQARSRDPDRDYDRVYDRNYERDHGRDYDRDYDRGRSSYRRSSRSPRHERDEGDYDYYRSRNDDQGPLPYDDDQTNYRGPDRDRDCRPASRSPPARRYAPPPAQPSATIVVQGLPGDATEDDVIDGFASVSPDLKVFNADNIKTIRLRNNGRGRTIGFVEFAEPNAAAHFLEFHYPSLEFQLAHSRGVNSDPVSVGINYSWSRDDEGYERVREDRPRDTEDWKCAECAYMNYGSRTRCHRCWGEKPEGHYRRRDEIASYGPKLTGETDECPQQLPSQYIVIRGLEPSVTEELFAEGVKKLYIQSKPEPKKETHNKLKSTAPTARTASLGAKPDSLRRVFLVRDKKTNGAMRYGFAEFATLEDAQGAIEKFKASPKFAISSKPVTAAFIHTGVFIPHTGRVTDEDSSFVFHPIYNKNILLKYWDNRVYPSILKVSYDSDAAKQQSAGSKGKSDKAGDEAANTQDASAKKLKKFKINQPAAKPAMVMGPQMQMWAKKRAELVGQAQAQAELNAHSAVSSPALSEKGRGSTRTQAKDSYISYSDSDNLSCLLCMRKFDSLLALRDHEALNKDHIANLADDGKRDAAAEILRAQAKRPHVVTLRVANVSGQPSDMIYTSYADRDELHCLICQRKFTKAGMLSLHERQSEMHRLNLGDQSNIDRAISQLARKGKTPRKMVPAKNKGTQYRDRARERRQAFKQPNAPRRKAPKEDAAPPAKKAEKPVAPSKGAALLGKMGWSAGEGLGAEGSGRTEVIATDVYASGVGLGAEGGRLGDAVEEAARKTKDNYTDFVEVTRNKARERYEKLG